MKSILSWLRPWLVPVALVGLAIVLTVPWTYLVFRTIEQREWLENATSLARRVESHLSMAPNSRRPLDEILRAVGTEIQSDPAVQQIVFYDLTRWPEVQLLAVVGKDHSGIQRLHGPDVEQLRKGVPMQTKNEDFIGYRIPWMRNDRLIGVTYVELSRSVLAQNFRKKEWPLIKRVMAWTATAIMALSGVGIFAYHAWQRAGHVKERAELARQGLMAERGLTAAVLAHEIRNPLQALRFQLHSLRKNSDDPDRVSGTAQTIDSELLRIQQLVTDYLEHEKAITLRVQRVDLLEAARGLKRLMDELLRQTDTKLIIEPPRDGHPVVALCDPHALRQVLMNLVLNAQQAMQGTRKGGGQIIISIGHDDPFGTIDVADTGPGIPEDMRERLFKPFQTSKKEGHGIGLALVKRFVDNFGGHVTVDSQVEKGTTFHLRLPLSGHNELLGDAGVGMVVPPPLPAVEVAPVPVEPILAGDVAVHSKDARLE